MKAFPEKLKGPRAAAAALFVCLAVFLTCCVIWTAAQENQGQEGQDAASAAAEPQLSAETAVLIDAVSGRVLYDKRKDAHMYPASTTKIMTALLVLETTDPDESVEVSQNAASQEGSSIYLKAGEKIGIKELLYGMMLRSGNDAAVAAAEAAGGSTEQFAAMMNERAASLGLENTHFVNPSGLQDENHYSSAYDLAMIAREALKNDVFREIARHQDIPGGAGRRRFV